jgi:hypothetical protein
VRSGDLDPQPSIVVTLRTRVTHRQVLAPEALIAEATLPITRCPDCQVLPMELHHRGCDVAHYPGTGRQRLMQCDHDSTCDSLWTGQRVGDAECADWDWWIVFDQESGDWLPCPADTPEATEDAFRLLTHARWDADLQRYVRTS